MGRHQHRPDVQDLYIERVDGAGQVLTPQGWQKLATRSEVIRSRSAGLTLTVRGSRHGPLISDVQASGRCTAARLRVASPGPHCARWPVDAGFQQIRPRRRLEEFLTAARDFDSPQQNMVYADTEATSASSHRGASVRSPKTISRPGARPGWTPNTTGMFHSLRATAAKLHPAAGKSSRPTTDRADNYPYTLPASWNPPYRATASRSCWMRRPGTRCKASSASRRHVSLQVREILPCCSKPKPPIPGPAGIAPTGPVTRTCRLRRGALIVSAWLRELGRLSMPTNWRHVQREWAHRARFMYRVLADSGGAGIGATT